ncbi:MAG: hypothetical protein F2667_12565 [Actinobacteria bacterium]|uniref:Unannotated protein n=1 Tax=freshwater metagenome TaxID=449393 RepID=A0A6J6RZ93_9ZZZZ|nr:hypothetical protein [Actinomycetota bacterium]
MKLTLRYSELRKLLAPVIPHASTDDNLPVLCTIPVAVCGDYVVAQATNRFTAAFQRIVPATGIPKAGFETRIRRADATRALTLLRPSRGSDPEIVWSVDHVGRMRFKAAEGGLAIGLAEIDLTMVAPTISGGETDNYPNLSKLLPTTFDDACPEAGFNIEYLGYFRTALDANFLSGARYQGLQIRMGAKNKPLIVAAGPDFIGVIMPRRPTDDRSGRDLPGVPEFVNGWANTIPVVTYAAPPAEVGV